MEPEHGGMAELYVRYVPAGIRLAYLLTGDRNQAEDLAHEAFVRCVGRFTYLRSREAFDAYLRRAIVNLHTSGIRRRYVERAWLRTEGRRAAEVTASLPDVVGREDLWRALAIAARPPAGRPGAPLLRRPLRAGHGDGAGMQRRRREVARRARVGRPARP